MKPKEKAKDLFNKMYEVDDSMGDYPMCRKTSTQCALIAVDEIYNQGMIIFMMTGSDKDDSCADFVEYWEEVKLELQKL